jgi:hypothetical protein
VCGSQIRAGDGQETGEWTRIVRNYMAASGLEYEWWEAPSGPAEPGNGILHAYLGGLSGAIHVKDEIFGNKTEGC